MADLLKVMQREQLHSEHAAICYLDAKRRDNLAKKKSAKNLTEIYLPKKKGER